MRRLITLFVLAHLGGLYFNSPSVNSVAHNSLSIGQTQISEGEIIEKLNTVLDEELASACITTSAARQLNDLTKSAAATIIQQNTYDRIPEAENNARQLGRKLLANANKTAGGVKITKYTIESTFRPRSLGSLCPLFPFCK